MPLARGPILTAGRCGEWQFDVSEVAALGIGGKAGEPVPSQVGAPERADPNPNRP